MVGTYPVGDFLIRIKNAAMAKNKEVVFVNNKKAYAVAEALKRLGFLNDLKKDKEGIKLNLAFKDKRPIIQNIKLVTKPGLRIYMGIEEIESKKGPSIYLVSTPKGIVSDKEAIKIRSGGEVIAEIL